MAACFGSRVSEKAAERVRELALSLSMVFAHPDVLQEEPRVIRYYRCLALLPQKGMTRLAFDTKRLEEHGGNLSPSRALALAKALNGLIALQIESDPEWTLERAEAAALLNFGSQINGSWRNVIGEEGNRQVRLLLASFLVEEGYVTSIILIDGTRPPLPIETEGMLRIREIIAINGRVIRFASEPDVAVRTPDGMLVGTIEVKYGSDPAGALERYGAAKKSFEAAVQANAHVQNVYLANVITDEVQRRIQADRLVSEAFEFRKLLVGPQERTRFLRFFTRRLLDI